MSLKQAMNKEAKIYVAGHQGLVGAAILRRLKKDGYSNIITCTHSDLDLTRQKEVEDFFRSENPEYVFLAAAKVGGILANDNFSAEFIYINLAIQTNILHASYETGVKRLLFLGSSCIYPRDCPQPMKEDYLLTGPLEATNEAYAIAKIAGIKMCQSYNRQYNTRFLAAMPTNLYGPNDNFDLENSHVLPALIHKFHLAANNPGNKQPDVEIWGTGAPQREFLYVDDLADACIFLINLNENKYMRLLESFQMPLVNIGYGKDLSIKDLAEMVKDVVGFRGNMYFDATKPDGTPKKLLDVSRLLDMGWKPKTTLRQGIEKTYKWCLNNSIF